MNTYNQQATGKARPARSSWEPWLKRWPKGRTADCPEHSSVVVILCSLGSWRQREIRRSPHGESRTTQSNTIHHANPNLKRRNDILPTVYEQKQSVVIDSHDTDGNVHAPSRSARTRKPLMVIESTVLHLNQSLNPNPLTRKMQCLHFLLYFRDSPGQNHVDRIQKRTIWPICLISNYSSEWSADC